MIDHISVGVSDLRRSTRFYEGVLAAVGCAKLVERATTIGFGKAYPDFWINLRAGLTPVDPRSGAHVCLRGRDIAAIDAFHAAAVAGGGTSEGEPGFREHDGEGGYYAAFVRDPDGNRIEAVTFTAG